MFKFLPIPFVAADWDTLVQDYLAEVARAPAAIAPSDLEMFWWRYGSSILLVVVAAAAISIAPFLARKLSKPLRQSSRNVPSEARRPLLSEEMSMSIPLTWIMAGSIALAAILFFLNGGSADEMFYGVGRAVVLLAIAAFAIFVFVRVRGRS